MTKMELALLYLPYYTGKAAVRRLMAWVKETPGVMEALTRSGYRDRQRNLTPQQVEIIERGLGRP